MKLAFLVTSTIEVDNTHNFIYQPHFNRSIWTNEQRLEQTQYTIEQIKKIAPNADIFLLDSSRNFSKYAEIFSTINYIPIYKLDPKLIEITHTSKIKGLCETLILDTFITHYKESIISYDFLIKNSGRYYINETFNFHQLNAANLDKVFVKNISWVEIEKYRNTGYEKFLNLESEFLKNRFPYTLTALYAIGNHKFKNYFDAIKKIITIYNNQNVDDVALETVFHEALLKQEHNIEFFSWEILGKCGVTGESIHY